MVGTWSITKSRVAPGMTWRAFRRECIQSHLQVFPSGPSPQSRRTGIRRRRRVCASSDVEASIEVFHQEPEALQGAGVCCRHEYEDQSWQVRVNRVEPSDSCVAVWVEQLVALGSAPHASKKPVSMTTALGAANLVLHYGPWVPRSAI